MQSPKLNFIYPSFTVWHFVIIFFLCFLLLNKGLYAQTDVRLREYNSFDVDNLYNADKIAHTAWKPALYTDTILPVSNDKWLKRKFFEEHLVQVQTPGFNFYGDINVDEFTGFSSRYKKLIGSKIINTETPGTDTRGYEVTGNIGEKFYYQTDFYENQGRFGGYVDSSVRQYHVIPGVGSYKNIGDGSGFDFSTSSGKIIYIPNKVLLFDLGYGKNFIGDGYRSLLLSDWSSSYPYLRTSITFGKFQYSIMWAQYISNVNDQLNNNLGYFRKWSQTYLLDWKATKNLSLSLFESVIWPDQVHNAVRSSDISPWLLSPIIFAHGGQSPSGVPNFDIVGLNAKYKIITRTFLYGQYVINQLGSSSSWQDRTGYQIGIRSGDVFNVKHFNIQLEFNTVRPYTYAGNSSDVNYTNANQALADPLGANFKEGVLVTTYSCKRFWFRAEAFIAHYGADSGNANYGSNIFLPLNTNSVVNNAKTGQGVPAKIYFGDIRVAYILNPASNLRIEAGMTIRRQSSAIFDYDDNIFHIGVRMSFRNLIYDF